MPEIPQKNGVGIQTEFPDLYQKLTTWGLGKYETAVYLFLLTKNTSVGGSVIARDTGLHRPYVYAALPKLLALSLIIKVTRGKQSRYKAAPPSQLEKVEMQRVVETNELIQRLAKISKVSYEQDAEIFIGREAIIKHQLDWVKSAKTGTEQYLLGGSGKAMRELFGSDLRHNARLQGEKKFVTYYLCGEDEKKLFGDYTTHNVTLHLRSMPIIPDMLPTIAIRGDTVEIHSYFNPPIMYAIKSLPVAEKFKVFFLGLWDMAGKEK